MAEVGVVASIIGISTFGVKLTLTLYDFGSTASSAREQTDRIARTFKKTKVDALMVELEQLKTYVDLLLQVPGLWILVFYYKNPFFAK
jgi:hypothetical protein